LITKILRQQSSDTNKGECNRKIQVYHGPSRPLESPEAP
jgi:hypothetical protein